MKVGGTVWEAHHKMKGVISQKVFIELFCESQFPHKFVNLFFLLVMIKIKWTYLSGNLLL